MYNNKQLATAVFTGMVVVFLYLMISPAAPTVPVQSTSLLGAVFNYGLSADQTSAIAFRAALLFAGAFSGAWLALSLLFSRKA